MLYYLDGEVMIPHEMYSVYSSKYAGIDYYNTGFYKNEKVDEYFEKASNCDRFK